MSDIFKGLGVEIELPNPESFLKVKETLTRMGISSRRDRKLYQSCHILHKQGRYVILHFKELFILDGKHNDMTDVDVERRNRIVRLLQEWNLVKIVFEGEAEPVADLSTLKVISHKDKSKWELVPKYSIGKRKEYYERTSDLQG